MSAVLSGTDTGRASLGALFRLAIAAGVPRAVEIQIRRGAPLDGRDASGRSPLMLAASRGHLELCRLLLSCGANLSLVDDMGVTALQHAQSRGHSVVVRLIEGRVVETTEAVDHLGFLERNRPSLTPRSDDDIGVSADEMKTRAERVSALEALSLDTGEPIPSAPPYGRPSPGEPGPARSEVDEVGETEQLSTTREHSPVASLLGMGADLAAMPFIDVNKIAWGEEWEPEEDPVLPTSDSAIEVAALAIDLQLAAHQPIVDDADWSDVEVELPVSWGLWARSFREDFDAVHYLGKLLDTAIFEGRIAAGSVAEFLSNTPFGDPDERLERHLVAALDALGILVEDDQTSEPPDSRPEVSSGRATHDRSISRDVVDFLDDMAAESCSDMGLLESAMRRFPPPPSAAEEIRLFNDHQMALDRIVLAVSQHPAARAIIMGWLRRVQTGDLTVQDLFRHASIEKDDQESAQAAVPADPSAVAALHMLVETIPAAPTEKQNRTLADGIIAIGLAPERIVEMAEAILPQAVAARPLARRMLTARREVSHSEDDPAATAATTGTAIVDAVQKAVDHYLLQRDLIVAVNLRMVVWQGRRYVGAALPMADLVQEGTVGLLRAIQRFDPEKGSRFATYAIWWIRQAMSRSYADTKRTIRLPVHVQDRRSRLGKLENRLERTLGRQPDPVELSVALGETVEAVRRLQRLEIEIIPLERVLADEQEDLPDGGPVSTPAWLVDFEPSPLDRLLHADLRASLEHGLGRLDQRQRRILVLRFGLEDGIPRTLEEVGELHGVTRERIRQIEAKALGRLRRLLPSKNFEAMQP